ncbi:MAG: ATP-binding protein [Nitrospirae bacterium]|nr:ATP-binding protein [Nitrospirota bacterium]
MKRFVETPLLHWKQDPWRKVLLLRGARQVGKTYSVRELGKTFPYYVEINLDETPALKELFVHSLTVHQIIERLAVVTGIPIKPGETLLFLDEIQACPAALSALRYFQEKLPALHVVAAGSLLEFALSEIPSMGVGRLHSLFMYPLSFMEYLFASGQEALYRTVMGHPVSTPLEPVIHHQLLDQLKLFYMIGGLPGVIDYYLKTHDLLRCQELLQDLATSYEDDFAKYKNKVPVARLREGFQSIIAQAGHKFSYTRVDSNSYHKAIKEALDLLILAGLAYKVPHSSCRGIPLGATINPKYFKILPFDIGIAQRVLGLDLAELVLQSQENLINKGAITEVYCGLELIHSHAGNAKPELFYWHRESRGSQAELDYVIAGQSGVLPIEVKAGSKGQMQSMNLFLKEHKLPKGIRISQENFSVYDHIQVLPLYAASRCWTLS